MAVMRSYTLQILATQCELEYDLRFFVADYYELKLLKIVKYVTLAQFSSAEK